MCRAKETCSITMMGNIHISDPILYPLSRYFLIRYENYNDKLVLLPKCLESSNRSFIRYKYVLDYAFREGL